MEKFALTENKKLRNIRTLAHFVTPPYLLLLSLRSPSATLPGVLRAVA